MDTTETVIVTVTATEASRSFSDLLHRVCYGGESFIIKKGNRLMARIVPVEPAENSIAVTQEKIAVKIEEAVAPELMGEEAEFYQAWMEQVRKVDV